MTPFEYMADIFLRIFPNFKEVIDRSEIQTTARDYLSHGIRNTVLVFLSLYALAQLVFVPYILNFPGVEFFFIFGWFAPLSLVAGLLVLLAYIMYPHIRRIYLSSKISSALLSIMAFLYALSSSGTSFDDMIEFIVESFDKHEAIAFSKYLYYRNVMGWDASKALKRSAERCPNYELGEILELMANAVVITEDITPMIETLYNKTLTEKRLELEAKINSLTFMSEIYISLMVVLPVLAITMLVIIAMMGGALVGLNPVILTSLTVYLLIPLSLAFIVVLSTGE